jgi:hypothetical protein
METRVTDCLAVVSKESVAVTVKEHEHPAILEGVPVAIQRPAGEEMGVTSEAVKPDGNVPDDIEQV